MRIPGIARTLLPLVSPILVVGALHAAQDDPPTGGEATEAATASAADEGAVDALPEAAVVRLGSLRLRHDKGVNAVAFGPGGEFLSGSDDRTIRAWSVEDGSELWRVDTGEGAVKHLRLYAGGTRLLASTHIGITHVWDARTREEIGRIEERGYALEPSRSGELIAAVAAEKALDIVQLDEETGELVEIATIEPTWDEIEESYYTLTAALWQPGDEGLILLAENRAKSLRRADTADQPSCYLLFCDTETWEVTERVAVQDDWLRRPVLTSDASAIVSGTRNGELVAWSTATREPIARWMVDGSGIVSVAPGIEPDRVVVATESGLVRIANLADGADAQDFETGATGAISLAFSEDGRLLGSASGLVAGLWSVEDGGPALDLARHESGVSAVAFSRDGKHVATGGYDRTVRVWDVESGACLHVMRGHIGPIYGLEWAPDGTWLASGSQDGIVRLWDPRSGGILRDLSGHTMAVTDVAVSNDGGTLVSASADQTLRVWDIATGEMLETIPGLGGLFCYVEFTEDGKHLVSASTDIRFWNPTTWEERRSRRISGFGPMVTCLATSSDSQLVATGHADRNLILWNVGDSTRRHRLLGHDGRLTGVQFAPGGTRMASTSWSDTTLRVWDGASGRSLDTLPGHEQEMLCVDFDPSDAGGTRVVTGSMDGTAIVWDLAP